MKNKINIGNILVYSLLIIVLIFTVFPIISVVLASFKSNSEIMTKPESIIPLEFTFDNYVTAWHSDTFKIGRMLFNSTWYSGISVVITLITSAVSGYVFARGEFRGKKLIFAVFSALMFVSLGSITIYPTFDILALLGLNSSLFGLIVMQCFGIPIVNMYLIRGFVNALPKELDEAARIDGCTFTGIFVRIIFPMLKPVLITIGLLSFNGSWNNYFYPSLFTMSRPEQQTLIVGIMALKNSSEAATAWNLLYAATTIAVIPVLVVFAIGNQKITDGMSAGAVKG